VAGTSQGRGTRARASSAPAQPQAEPERSTTDETPSGIPIKELYRPEDVADLDYHAHLGDPGEYPFARGVYPNMYRGRLWTRRVQVGFGTPEETNERLKFLFTEGQAGFILTIDLPTSYGFDSDEEIAEGEVGVTGVPISTLEDMEMIFDGFNPDTVSASLSIRPPVSAVTLAMLALVAENRGIALDKVIGTQQNDPLFQMSGGPHQTVTQFFPWEGTLRLCLDIVEFASRQMPKLNWMVTNAYNLRDTGVSAAQEAAFSLAHAVNIFELACARGLRIDEFAPRASFFSSCGIDFFEEIAKFRAERRIWARLMRERFGAEDPRSWRFRTSVQTAGNTLTTQEPLNNIVRATSELLAAVLSGVQSVHLSAYDEGLSLPTEQSQLMCLRTQQIVGYETGVTRTVDPLAGSYFIENLTDAMEEQILRLMADVDEQGGLIQAARSGWLESEITKARVAGQYALERGERTVVGVNRYVSGQQPDIDFHVIRAEDWGARRAVYLRDYRARRNQQETDAALEQVRLKMREDVNMIPVIMDALRARATLGEIHGAMREAHDFVIDY
jgi:methylmalonyl-CoA mutase N-terminal domain/subunit